MKEPHEALPVSSSHDLAESGIERSKALGDNLESAKQTRFISLAAESVN